MGDAEEGNSLNSYSLESNNGSLSSIQENNNSPVRDHSPEVEDFRISCSSEINLNKIMRIVAEHCETFAKSACSEDKKSQFVTRTLEVFKDYVQDNVTLKGLPYTANAECFSPDEKQIQNNETKDALFADLSKKINTCASKRKEAPKNFCRILDMRLQHERHNLKRAKLKHSVHLPLVTEPSFKVDLLSSQKLIEADMDFKATQVKNSEALKELNEIKKSLETAQEIALQKPYVETLHDTGYDSFS